MIYPLLHRLIHFLHQWKPLNVVPGTSWPSVKFQPLTLNWGHLSVILLLIEETSHTCWISSLDSRNQQETNRPQAVRTHNNWCNWKSSALPLQSVPALDLKLYCRTFRLHSAATVLWDIISHNNLHLYSQVEAFRYLYTTLPPAAIHILQCEWFYSEPKRRAWLVAPSVLTEMIVAVTHLLPLGLLPLWNWSFLSTCFH